MRLGRIGRSGSMARVHAAAPAADRGRIEYRYPGHAVTEWYVNEANGLEQGFVLSAPPRGGKRGSPVVLEMKWGGDLDRRPGRRDNDLVISTTENIVVLTYAGLQARDRIGRDVPARLNALAKNLQIIIDDRDATYPIEVDPLLTSPSWMAEGNQTGAAFGSVVAPGGDINGDGYDDVLIGAPAYDHGEPDEGRVYLFYGSASGLSLVPAWSAEGDRTGARFGEAVSSAGDVNRDGFADIVVGAPHWLNDLGQAYVYLGSASGPGATPAWTRTGQVPTPRFGASVAAAGDTNNDGFDDVIIGAPGWSFRNCVTPGGPAYLPDGKAFVFNGSCNGLAQFPNWEVGGSECGATFGFVVAGAGDVNGDDFDDVVVLDGKRAQVLLFPGTVSGPSSASSWTAGNGQAVVTGIIAAAAAGDVNGDGYDDLALGSPSFANGQSDEGAVFVFAGSASGPGAGPTWTAEGNEAGAGLGQAVAGAGDVDGDTYDDLVAAGSTSHGGTLLRAAFVFRGSAAGLDTSPASSFHSDQPGDAFGFSVAGAGDVDRDGRSEVLVGDPSYTNDEAGEGRAFLFTSTLPSGTCTDADGDGFGFPGDPACRAGIFQDCDDHNPARHPGALEACDGADNDCDGEVDEGFNLGTTCTVGVGACATTGETICANGGQGTTCNATPLPSSVELCDGFDNDCNGLADDGLNQCWVVLGLQAANLGASVAGAGDVNRDGYADFIVGGPDTDLGVGVAYLYYGSSGGASRTPGVVITPWPSGYRSFGGAVAGAGDINADGFADLIVGGPTRPASTYFGSASGVNLDRASVGDLCSTSVASAGDVDGDGFGDVIVGCSAFNRSATAAVFRGSAQGVSDSPAWILTGPLSSGLGVSVSSAGDVNDDGFVDLIVGANIENKAYLYYGSPLGPSTSSPTVLSGPSGAVRFGSSVAGAGDLDRDGFDDVIVGDPFFMNSAGHRYGKVFVYLGSSAGLGLTPAWDFAGGPGLEGLGASVAGAGDMERDGFPDVLVGAPTNRLSHVLAFRGSPTGPSGTISWIRSLADPFQAFYGTSVAFAGDVDGDGTDDIVVGAPYAGGFSAFFSGAAYLYYGGIRCGDADGDGFGSATDPACPPLNDCNDADPFVHPTEGETCDGRDNDCDGPVDEDSTDAGKGCATGLPGVCLPGNTACQDGSVVCVQRQPASEEVCDALDNDCDGSVDEDIPPVPCPLSAAGVCGQGLTTCIDGYINCQQAGVPSPEICDCLDNDCDGATDEEVPEAGQLCDTGLPGDCAAGNMTCSQGALLCRATGGALEICDGVDNDCNGRVDEGVCDGVLDILIEVHSPFGRGSGLITWRTDGEAHLAGFNVLVLTNGDLAVRQNPVIIPCEECVTLAGHAYSFILPKHKSGRDVYIETVLDDGSVQRFGPAVKR